MSFWSRITYAFRGDRLNREIDEEFAAHIEEAIAAGDDPAEVRRTFGSQLRLREQSRDARIVAALGVRGRIGRISAHAPRFVPVPVLPTSPKRAS